MRKIALLGLILVSSTGCGGALFPGLFRGARCGSCGVPGAVAPAPVQTSAKCNGCGTTGAGYGSYEGEIVGGEYYGSEVLGSGYYGGSGAVVTDGAAPSPSMSPLTNP